MSNTYFTISTALFHASSLYRLSKRGVPARKFDTFLN